jgi:hypothetical protein
MQGQGGDQMDMEEMQRVLLFSMPFSTAVLTELLKHRDDVLYGQWTGWSWRRHARDGRYVQDDGHGWRWSLIIRFIRHALLSVLDS